MTDRTTPPEPAPYLQIAPRVTRHYGELFADVFLALSKDTGALGEAFDATCRITWEDSEDEAEAQARYLAISREITERVANAIRPVLVESFVLAARVVLARERRRAKGENEGAS